MFNRLKLWFPLIVYGSFYGTGRQTGAAIDAGLIVDVRIFHVVLVHFALSPVYALYRTNRKAVR
jgi:hypothetical protein